MTAAGMFDDAFRVVRRARTVRGLAFAAVVLNVTVVVTGCAFAHAFTLAPNDRFTQPGDDPVYAATGFGYGVTSILRYLVLLLLLVALIRLQPGSALRRWPTVAVVTGVELAHLALTVGDRWPDTTWLVSRVGTCVVSAAVCGAIVAVQRAGPARH